MVLDVSDPENINLLAQYNDGGDAYHVTIGSNLIFVSEFKSGLETLKLDSSLYDSVYVDKSAGITFSDLNLDIHSFSIFTI